VETLRVAHYGAATARLVVAGRFDVDEVSKRIKDGLGKWPAGKTPEPRAPAGARVTGTLVMGDAPSAMALAIPVPEPKDSLYPAFLVLAARLAVPDDPLRVWRVDFAPLARPDILFVTAPLPQARQAEAAAARIRAEVNAIVTVPLAPGESDRALQMFGVQLGMTPLDAKTCAAAPYEAAFAAGRRAQLGIDGTALAQATHSITPDQVAAAALLFDNKNSAAVIAGGKL
jgi:predicted Zn-dependent peptidase